ncbi:MFS transporter [Halopseudomonas pachastrellae]|nr:MFS transporter [Halopseudomonas pachastrellae]
MLWAIWPAHWPRTTTACYWRVLSGLPHGAYFGVAALVAASLVAPNKRAAAISLVMLGLTLAILVGNPLATLLGQQIDWRYAFVAVAVIALLTVLLIALFLPLDRSVVRSNPLAELQAFRRIQVWYALGIGAIGFAGMFCVFSYLAVTLLEVTGVAPLVVPLAVATFGAGTLVGIWPEAGCLSACNLLRSGWFCSGVWRCCCCFPLPCRHCGVRCWRRFWSARWWPCRPRCRPV